MTIKSRARHEKLLALVAVIPMKINDLAVMLGVSSETVRCDIGYLDSRKRLNVKRSEYGMSVSAS